MKIGFIGTGNMGSAMMGGMISAGMVEAEDVMASDIFQAALDKVSEDFGVRTSTNNRDTVEFADIVFLAVKPQYLAHAIDGIKDMDFSDKIVVSIAAGQSLEKLSELFGKELKLIRVMPNTPALVGEGMTGVSPSDEVTEEELAEVMKILSSFGEAEVVPEKIMEAVVSVSGSSPAYVFMMIEAMADGAVRLGMPRNKAYKFAAQAVYGSAKMVLETGKHPGELKDMVCSPAGTTIEAVRVLEDKGFRSSLIEAMEACADISRKL